MSFGRILAPAFSIDAIGFITVVAIFSAVRFILAPLITQLSMRHARMLVGGVSLVTILVSFFVTSLLTNHLAILASAPGCSQHSSSGCLA